MKVLFCGSRAWNDWTKIWEVMREVPFGSHIITGGAKGADLMCERVARQMQDGLVGQKRFSEIEIFRADWKQHGKGAGYVRNLKMLDQKPDLVIAFWNGNSRGTRHTIGEAVKRGIPVKIIQSDDASTDIGTL